MRRNRLVTAIFLGAALSSPLRADDDQKEHDLARRLVAEGQIKPLQDILAQLQNTIPGEMLEVELESEKGVYKYEIKVLRPGGKVQEVEIDARSGNILKVEDDD